MQLAHKSSDKDLRLELKYSESAICHKQHIESTLRYSNPKVSPSEFMLFISSLTFGHHKTLKL